MYTKYCETGVRDQSRKTGSERPVDRDFEWGTGRRDNVRSSRRDSRFQYNFLLKILQFLFINLISISTILTKVQKDHHLHNCFDVLQFTRY
jgi:hypothetical protein